MKFIHKLINFIDDSCIPPDLDINEDEIQQTVTNAWKIAIKPRERRKVNGGSVHASG